MQERRDQFHTQRLGESLDPFNAAVSAFLEPARGIFLQQTGDLVAAQQLALQALENLRQQQASALAYFDVFLMFAVVMLMQRSVAEKGAHIGPRMSRTSRSRGRDGGRENGRQAMPRKGRVSTIFSCNVALLFSTGLVNA